MNQEKLPKQEKTKIFAATQPEDPFLVEMRESGRKFGEFVSRMRLKGGRESTLLVKMLESQSVETIAAISTFSAKKVHEVMRVEVPKSRLKSMSAKAFSSAKNKLSKFTNKAQRRLAGEKSESTVPANLKFS